IQGDNALRLRGQTKLRCRANHAIGNMVISLARGNLETTRQNRTGQRNRHDRAFFKITSTTDNALQLTCAVGVADVNLAITNRLFELSSFFDFLNSTDDHGTRDFWQRLIAFGFKTDADEACIEFFTSHSPVGVVFTEDAVKPVL